MPEAVELLCVGGAARGISGFDSWLCARCLGMILGVLVGALVLAFESRRPGHALALLLAMASLNAVQHGLAETGSGTGLDAGAIRLALGAAFGLAWSALIASRLDSVVARRIWGGMGLGILIWLGVGVAIEADRARGLAELAAYLFMAGSLVLAASEQVRVRMWRHATMG